MNYEKIINFPYFKSAGVKVHEYDQSTEQLFVEANEKWTDQHRISLEQLLKSENPRILVSRIFK